MVRTAGRDGTTDLDVRPLMLFFLSRLLDDEPSPPGRRGRITSLPLRGDVPGPLLVRWGIGGRWLGTLDDDEAFPLLPPVFERFRSESWRA
jgi:hypothetical protein